MDSIVATSLMQYVAVQEDPILPKLPTPSHFQPKPHADHPSENRLFAGMHPAVDDMLADRGPVPFDSVAGLLRGDSHASFHPDTGRCHRIQLRYVFEIAAVGHCAAEPKMQLHEEVRTDRHIKGFRHMGNFEPR